MKRVVAYGAFAVLMSMVLFACAPTGTEFYTSSPEMPDSSTPYSEPQPELQPQLTSSKNEGWNGPMSVDTSLGYTAVISELDDDALPASDQVFRAYQFDYPGKHQLTESILYLLEGEVWRAVDTNNRIQVSFEPSLLNDNTTDGDTDFDVIVCNSVTQYVKYYGEEAALAPELLFPALNGQMFDLYSGLKHIGAYQSKMIPGGFEDEIFMDFSLGEEGINTIAVFGGIAPVTLIPQEEALVAERYPYSQYEFINKRSPQRAFQLGDTEGQLLEFYVTDKNQTVYHIFALSTPEQKYREVYRQQKPIEHFPVPPEGYDPTYSEVLFAGLDRNGEYHIVFLVAGKGLTCWTELFRFTV